MPDDRFDDCITFCPTADLRATTHFYHGLLGLEVALEQPGCTIFRVRGHACIGFCERAGETVTPQPGLMLTLVTEDVDGWHARLIAHGVPIDRPPTWNERYRIYHLFARDPNGYVIEIQRFGDPAWHSTRSAAFAREAHA